MEAGQLLHSNPVGYPTEDFVDALMSHLRHEVARVYWNVNQKEFYDSGSGDIGDGLSDEEYYRLRAKPPLGIPGMEWWPYYNWEGSPDDEDWDQAAANRPNFSFEGVEVRWYKYFGRSMNVNVVWPAEKWVRWFERCMQTLRAWESMAKEPIFGFYPDPAGIVSLAPETADLRHVALMQQVDKLEAQINSMACVCLDVEARKYPIANPYDWRWCKELEWVIKLGQHACLAPEPFHLVVEE